MSADQPKQNQTTVRRFGRVGRMRNLFLFYRLRPGGYLGSQWRWVAVVWKYRFCVGARHD